MGQQVADADVVVIGAGTNGLTAAAYLARVGLRVVVLEANQTPGGAVRTAEVTLPGFRHDLWSGFYPLLPVSPIAGLPLARHGLHATNPSRSPTCSRSRKEVTRLPANCGDFRWRSAGTFCWRLTRDWVADQQARGVTSHVAQNTGRQGGSAIDGRTTRHPAMR